MSLTTEQKANIIKKFLDGTTLETISRRMKITDKQVVTVLKENKTTHEMLLKYLAKYEAGEYVNFFYRSMDLGRPKLPENQKRKVKQIRLSEDEMNELGNPSSTNMRRDLFAAKIIRDFCKILDEKGVELIPEEWIEKEYSKTDSWYSLICGDNFSRLLTVSGNKKCRDSIRTKESDQ
jgi:hypothetical protein